MIPMKYESILLLCMVLSYTTAIGYVVYYYSMDQNKSISSIITMEECQLVIFASMILMGIFTVLYEWKRNCIPSMCTIGALLLGIMTVILIKEDQMLHYVGCFFVFTSMIAFMMIQLPKWTMHQSTLKCMIGIHGALTAILVFLFVGSWNIFGCEVLLLISFATYYLFIHYLMCSDPDPHHDLISFHDDPIETDQRQQEEDRTPMQEGYNGQRDIA